MKATNGRKVKSAAAGGAPQGLPLRRAPHRRRRAAGDQAKLGDAPRLPWLFVSERGQPLTRQAVNYLIGAIAAHFFTNLLTSRRRFVSRAFTPKISNRAVNVGLCWVRKRVQSPASTTFFKVASSTTPSPCK
jgi:hypothetical protein